MDMFTDKLAEKLAAQEIIAANSAADAEQINRLKNQIVEYDECLSRLRGLIEDGAARLESSKGSEEDIERLVQESIKKIREMQQDAAQLEEFAKRLEERIEGINDVIDDNVHKECVKVYRNVQAVVNEQTEKDHKAIVTLSDTVAKSGKKMGAIFGISIAALIVSLAGVVLQVLSILKVF
ncbi:MAG: hypothetical protein MJ114_08705 [Acetatifactor sp.]|nr:hypothetical protein [Acetatifactor sp.]